MNQNINATAYFKQAVYEDIDDYLIYMFRLYQATQARLVQGLNTSIDRTVGVSSKLLLVQGAILVIILFHWFYKMDAEMLKISNLYSQVLQFPKAIVKDNKNIMTTIRRIFMLKG